MLLGVFPATIQRVLVITQKRYGELVKAGVLLEVRGRCDFCPSVQRYICYLNTLINNKKIKDMDDIPTCHLAGKLTDNDILSMTKMMVQSDPEKLDLDLPEDFIAYV